jgi:hypothetical protein
MDAIVAMLDTAVTQVHQACQRVEATITTSVATLRTAHVYVEQRREALQEQDKSWAALQE